MSTEAPYVQKVIAKEVEKDPLFYYKSYVKQRWLKGIDNFYESCVSAPLKKRGRKAIDELGPFLLFGHIKKLEMLSDPD